MNGPGTLHFIWVFLITSSAISKDTSTKCGVFHFYSRELHNGSLVVKENTTVNITFSILQTCNSTTFGAIYIYKWDIQESKFARQCTILQTCKDQLDHTIFSCQCLDSEGLYGFTIFVQRQDSTLWKWSISDERVNDVVIQFNVTYPPHITDLIVEGHDGYIPRFKNVSVICSWRNGSPPSRVSLLDRHNTLLAMGDNSGDIYYTFKSIDCKDAGVIRCAAEGSIKNLSTILLIECPPEIVSKVMYIIVGQKSEVTLPFRSYTSEITACQMTHLNRNQNSDAALFQRTFKLSDLSSSEGNMSLGNMSCGYAVIGLPPEFHLSINFRNLTSEDVGLWYVDISNNRGSDSMFIQVHVINGIIPTPEIVTKGSNLVHYKTMVNEDVILQPAAIIGVVLGVIVFTVIVFIIIYFVKYGGDLYTKLKKRELEDPVVYRTLASDPRSNALIHFQRGSRVYDEINDADDPKGTQCIIKHNSTDQCVSSSYESLSRVQVHTMHDQEITPNSLRENEPQPTDIIQLDKEDKNITTENPITSISVPSDYLLPVEKRRETSQTLMIVDPLQIAETRSETNPTFNILDPLQTVETSSETNPTLKIVDPLLTLES